MKTNERIKELVNIASEYADYFDRIGVDHTFQTIFNEKFAQLIVQDCLEFCRYESDDDDDQFDSGVVYKAQEIKTNIMKHFGVEE